MKRSTLCFLGEVFLTKKTTSHTSVLLGREQRVNHSITCKQFFMNVGLSKNPEPFKDVYHLPTYRASYEAWDSFYYLVAFVEILLLVIHLSHKLSQCLDGGKSAKQNHFLRSFDWWNFATLCPIALNENTSSTRSPQGFTTGLVWRKPWLCDNWSTEKKLKTCLHDHLFKPMATFFSHKPSFFHKFNPVKWLLKMSH